MPGWRARGVRGSALASFAVGAVAGGLLTAITAWVVSGLAWLAPAALRGGAVAVVVALLVLHELGVLRLRLPQTARQVPQEVLFGTPVRAAARFGVEMGSGVRTFVTATAPYVVVLALLLLSPGLDAAVLAGVAFGLSRGLVPIAWHLSWNGPRSWERRFDDAARLVARSAFTLCAVGALALAARTW